MNEENKPLRVGNIYGADFGTGYAGNVWSADYISPTLTTNQGGGRVPMILEVKEPKIIKVGNYSKDQTSEGGGSAQP